jgi:inosine-uridine nucleoside N-ribohydrolase
LSTGKLEHVPVYIGADHPLIGPIIAGDGDQVIKLPFPEPTIKPQEKHAVNFLIDYYMSDEGKDTIYMPIGPLTNLGLALRIEPRLKEKIPQIVTMGGAYATSFAEFNIKADPEAAFIVYEAGIPIKMIGLEVTDMAKVMQKDVNSIRAIGTPWAAAAADIMDIVVNIHSEHFGKEGGIIFDACAVAAVIEPEVVKTEPMHVTIELTGSHTRGCTVAALSRYSKEQANVDVGVSIDRERFIEIMHESLT